MQRALKHRAQKDQLLRISHGLQQQAIEEFLGREAAQRAMKLNADYHNWLNTWFRFHPPEIPAVRIHSDEIHETTEGTVVRVQQELAERKREQELLQQQMEVERLIDILTHGGHVKPSGKKPDRKDPDRFPTGGGGGDGNDGNDDDDDDDGNGGQPGDTEIKEELNNNTENVQTQQQAEAQQPGYVNAQLPDHRAVDDPSQQSHNLAQERKELLNFTEHIAKYGRQPEPAAIDDAQEMFSLAETEDLGTRDQEIQAEQEGVTEAERVVRIPQELLDAELEAAILRQESGRQQADIRDLQAEMQFLQEQLRQAQEELQTRPTSEMAQQRVDFINSLLDQSERALDEKKQEVIGLQVTLDRIRRDAERELQERIEVIQANFREEKAEAIALAMEKQQNQFHAEMASLNSIIDTLGERIAQTESAPQFLEMEREAQAEKDKVLARQVQASDQLVQQLTDRIQDLEAELANSVSLQQVPGTSAAAERNLSEERKLRMALHEHQALVLALQQNIKELKIQLQQTQQTNISGQQLQEELFKAEERERELQDRFLTQQSILEEKNLARRNEAERMRRFGQQNTVTERLRERTIFELQQQLDATGQQLAQAQQQAQFVRTQPRASDLRQIDSMQVTINALESRVRELLGERQQQQTQRQRVATAAVPPEPSPFFARFSPTFTPITDAMTRILGQRRDRQEGARDIRRDETNQELRRQLDEALQRLQQREQAEAEARELEALQRSRKVPRRDGPQPRRGA